MRPLFIASPEIYESFGVCRKIVVASEATTPPPLCLNGLQSLSFALLAMTTV